MNEDDDDESGIGKVYNRQEAKHSNISFIWGSPLHKMTDIEGTDPYDTVDLVDLNAATASNGQDNQYTSIARGNSYESPYHSDTESTQNTFALFGYDHLGDLDTSDDEINESRPVHEFIPLVPSDTKPCHGAPNLLLGKLKGIPTYVGEPAEFDENHYEKNAQEMTKPVYQTLNAEDETTKHRPCEKDSSTFEKTSNDEFSQDQYNHMTKDTVENPCQEKKEKSRKNKCETIASNQTMSFKDHDNLKMEIQIPTSKYKDHSFTEKYCNDEEITEMSITEKEPITEETEEKILTEEKNSDHLAKSSCEREVRDTKNEIIIELTKTTYQPERTTDINVDNINQTPEYIETALNELPTVLYDETCNDMQSMTNFKQTSPKIIKDELSTPSNNEYSEASYKSDIKDSFSDNMNNITDISEHSHVETFSEISNINVEHDVVDKAILPASSDRGETTQQLQKSPNKTIDESKSENDIEDGEPLNLTKHDIKSSIKGNLHIIDVPSKADQKYFTNSTKSFGETIPEKRKEPKSISVTKGSIEHVTLSKTKETRKGNNQFHCNIKSSVIGTESLQDHTNRRQKSKMLAVKKEFDNSENFVKDLCLIGSNNLKGSRSGKSPNSKTSTDLKSNSLTPIEKRLSGNGTEPENILVGDKNVDLNIKTETQSLRILPSHENTDSLPVLGLYENSENTKEIERDEDFKENKSDQPFIIRHFGNKEDLKDCQHRSISSTFDKFGELNITKSLKGNEDIELKYKTRCQKIELSKSISKDASTIKSIPKNTKHEQTHSEVSAWQHFENQNISVDDSFEAKANQPWSMKPDQNWSQDEQDKWIPKWNQTSHNQSRMSYEDGNDFYHQETTSFPYSQYHSNVTANTDRNENRVSHSNPENNHYLNQEYNEMHSAEHSNQLKNDEQFSTYNSSLTTPADNHQSPKHNQIMRSGNSHLWKSLQNNGDEQPISNMPLVTRYRGNGNGSWYTPEHSDEGECNCCKCTVKQHLSVLTEFMEKIGYEVKNVSGDGNCLFAAIVDQLRINGDFSYTTDSLRKNAVQFLRKSPNVDENTHLEAFLTDETWDEYLAKMAMDGQWGDDIILKGISELTGRRIIVYSSFMSKTELTPTNLYEKDELYIGHIKSLMHFVSLRPYYWESLWALKATIHRGRQIMDKMRLDSTLLRSCEEEALKKIDELREAIAKGEMNSNDKFQEIEQIFRDLRKSMHKQTTELLLDTQDTMDDLLHQKFEVDKLSGIPMIHLSYLIKLFIQPKYFRNALEDLESIFESTKNTITRIGTGSLNLNVNLMDFTAAVQHLDILAKKVQRDTKPVPVTFVLKLSKEDYSIVDRTEDQGSISEHSLIVDDTDTYSGYTHLIPSNTAYWSGCVEWLSCKNAFLRGLPNKCRPKTLFQKNSKISVQLLDGFDCNIWPKKAQSWTQRNPISGWPSEDILREASEKGCTIVKRAHEFSENPDIEWQFVFNEAEKVLVRSFDDSMMFCFRVFKTLVDHHTRTLKVRLKTYSLLTVMLYCSEIIPQKAWSTNPGGCIMYIVVWLLQSIAQHNIPNYFIPENNMIEHIEDHDLKDLEVRLQVLRWFPFASVYFLLERHSFLNLSVIDNIESSIEEYKTSKDKHKLVESVFVPLCFKLATENMRCKIFPFYRKALSYLDVGFEQTVGVTDEDSMTFKDFILSFLTSVRDNEISLPFAQLVDNIKKTNICQDMLKDKATLPISDILGPDYKGEWRHVYVDISEDKWNSIYELTGHLFTSYELEECAEILRCSIFVLQKDLRDDGTDYTGITDDDTKKKLTKSRYQQVYFTLRYLVTFYKHLSKCYEAMDKQELFQEHIHDYEEIVGRIDSRLHYEYVAKLYRQLGNTEKAKELEDKVESMKGSGEQQKSRPLIVIFT